MAEKLREALVNDSTKLENICKLLKVTKNSIAASKLKFDALLEKRKIACLLSYIDFLNKEEELVRTQFQNESSEHIMQYPFTNDLEYYQNKLFKCDVELTIEKKSILEKICRSNLVNSSLFSVDLSMSDNFDFRDEHPMGELQVVVGKENLLCDFNEATPTLKISQHNDCRHWLSRFSTQSKDLLEAGRIFFLLLNIYTRSVFVKYLN